MHYAHHTSNRKTLPKSFRRRLLPKSWTSSYFLRACQRNFRLGLGTRLPLTTASDFERELSLFWKGFVTRESSLSRTWFVFATSDAGVVLIMWVFHVTSDISIRDALEGTHRISYCDASVKHANHAFPSDWMIWNLTINHIKCMCHNVMIIIIQYRGKE